MDYIESASSKAMTSADSNSQLIELIDGRAGTLGTEGAATLGRAAAEADEA